jgi:Trypsin
VKLGTSGACVAVLLSCAQGERTSAAGIAPLGQHAQKVVRGEASGEDQNAVVLLVRGAFLELCTGTVIAPDLVLTARHCLFEALLGENAYLHCERGDTTTVFAAHEPQSINVYVGNAKPLPAEPSAIGSAIHSSEDLDLCNNDVALLALDRPLPLTSLALRLDAPPRVGERGVLVGWGATGAGGPFLPDARQQREIRIDAVGPSLLTPEGGSPRELREAIFAGTEGGCIGDSGGPLISAESGAVIGVMSEIGNPDVLLGLEEQNAIENCTRGITEFQRLDRQERWLRQAFRERGLNPWAEGKRPPASPGEECTDGDECQSGICVTVGTQTLCSQECSDRPCPGDLQCVGPAEQRLCVPLEVAGVDGKPAGCGLSVASSKRGWPSYASILVLLVLSLRRHAHSSAWSKR